MSEEVKDEAVVEEAAPAVEEAAPEPAPAPAPAPAPPKEVAVATESVIKVGDVVEIQGISFEVRAVAGAAVGLRRPDYK